MTVELAHEVTGRLGIPLRLTCFAAARDFFDAMVDGTADLCFLAIEPARAGSVPLTAPYALIKGVFAVRADSPLRTLADVDRAGVRVALQAAPPTTCT